MPRLSDWFGQGVVVFTEFDDLADPSNPSVPIWQTIRRLLMRAVRDANFNWREDEDEDYEDRCVVRHRGESWVLLFFVDESFACREETLPRIRAVFKRKNVQPHWIEVRHRWVKILLQARGTNQERIAYRIEIYPRIPI